MHILFRSLKLVSLFSLIFNLAIAGTTGKLVGKVTDSNTGEALVGVNVIIDESSMGAATDNLGQFYILQIPPGNYSVTASMIGYNNMRVMDVRIQIDLTTNVDFELNPGVLGMEAVTVTATRPLVQHDRTYTQSNIGADQIEDLPVEEFEEIVALQAGVVISASGAMHVRGGRGSEIAYLVDGVSVTDPYSAGMAIEIENNAIQELQVISGTFNAEYGQAMSGIVNIVTKEGNYENYSSKLSLNLGDFFSDDTRVFPNIDDFSITSLNDVQFNLSGPVPGLAKRASFFVSGRYFYDEGYYYGQQDYLPNSYYWADSTASWELDTLGNGDFVPMNWSKQFSGQAKLSFKLTPRTKIAANLTSSKTDYVSYTHRFKYNPDGNYNYFRNNYSLISKLEHAFSPSTYITLRYSNIYNDYSQYVHKDAEDTLAYDVDPDVFDFVPSDYNFYVGGIRMGHTYRDTRVNTYKLNLVSQVSFLHQISAGLELRKSNLHFRDFTIRYSESTDYKPVIPDSTSPSYDEYTRTPTELSGFLQDKIEYDDLIINLGVRYDYFDPNWKVLIDETDPNYQNPLKPINKYFDENGDGQISISEMRTDNEKTADDRLAYWFKDVEVKQQISPRLAIAFPITDRGVMHVSYGHFFQMPAFRYLYANPDFETVTGGNTLMGNADLEPQRTTQYEIGFQQQLSNTVGIDVTGFYKDIRNLNGSRIIDTFVAGDRYTLYINQDFGNVRGVTFSLEKRRSGFLSGSVDYTFSIAEGNASDPAAAYYDDQNSNEPEKQLVALDWDQRHTLNGTVSFHLPIGVNLSLVGQYGTGQPYTPEFASTRIAFENTENKPSHYNIDLRSYYQFKLGKLDATLQLNIYNLTDRRNERRVYGDTGRAGYSLISTYVPEEQPINTLSEYLTRPDYYTAPRQLKIGLAVKI